MRLLPVALAGVLAGCFAGGRASVAVGAGVDLRSYRRIAVLPFHDPRGRGRALADETARGLWSLDFDVIAGDQLAGTLDEMGVRPGSELGPHALLELRRMSFADAVVTGDLDCPADGTRRRVSVVIQDTADAKTLFSMSFEPESCGAARDAAEIAGRVTAAVRRKLAPPAAAGPEGPY